MASLSALAGQSITIQGRVQDSLGHPLNGALTQFRVQVLTPDSSRCVLYDESQVIDLSQTNGLFSINLNNGTGTVNAPATYTLEQAISNLKGFAVNSSYCASGSGTVNYSPAATDNRKLVIQFRDPGSMSSFETIPEMDLNPVAIAMESRTLGGFPASSVLRVQDAGALGTATPLSSANFTELLSLLAGTSNNYMSSSGSSAAGARLPTYSGNPSAATTGSMWFDTSSGSGVLKFKDASGVVQTLGSGGGGGTITGITAGGALTGGGSSGAVTISLPATGVTGFGSAVGSGSAVPVITYDSYGRLTSVTTAAISGTLPAGTSGQFLKSSGGSTWAGAGILMGDLKNGAGTLPLFGTVNCSASQSMYWDSGADQIRCQNISIGNSQISDLAWSKITGVPNLVANAGGTPSLLTDTEANLPTVHVNGRIFIASDTKKIFRDNGTTWDQLGGASNAVVNALNTNSITTGPTASQPTGQVAGRLFINTTTQKIQYDNGTAWIDVASNGGSGFTGSLAGEVSGTQSATQVDSINGISRSTITTNLTAVTNATDAATPSMLVKRDASGDFAGRKITASEVIVQGTSHTASLTADPTANYSLKLPDDKASVNGQVLTSDTNGVLSWTTPSSAGSIAVTAPVTNTSGTIGIPSANTSRDGYLTQADWNAFSGKLSSALNSALIWVGNGSNVATPVAPSGDVTMTNAGVFTVNKIKGTNVSAVPTNAGQVLRYDGTDYAPAFTRMADLRSTVTGTSALTGNCTAAQTLTWNSGTDSLQCQNISIAAASQISGIVPVASGGTGTSTGSITGTGALTFTAGGSNQNVNLNPSGTGYTILSGNVGVGTSTPSHRLHVVASADNGAGALITTNGAWGAGKDVSLFLGDIGHYLKAVFSAEDEWYSYYGLKVINNSGTVLTIGANGGGNVGIGSAAPATSLDLSQKTDALSLPSGTTAQAPAASSAGRLRWNSQTNALEVSNGSAWISVLAGNAYSFSTGTTGNAPNWSNTGNSYTLNIPLASSGAGVTAGLLSYAEYIAKAPLASPTFTGTPAAPTAATDTNTTQLATTAFVVGQASSATPLVDSGAGAVGTSLKYARGDHVHPTDTSRAPAAGSSSITTVGTISTGTWNGTAIAVANGGTGTGSTSQNFVFAGPSSGAGAPSFRALTSGDLPGGANPWSAAAGGINYTGGNVGIGSASPTTLLDVGGRIRSADYFESVNGINGNLYYMSGWNYRYNGYGYYLGMRADANYASMSVAPSGTAGSAVIPSLSMAWTATGNVGIGTSVPGQKLTVVGTIESTSGGIKFPDGTVQTSAAGSGPYKAALSIKPSAQSIPSIGWNLVTGLVNQYDTGGFWSSSNTDRFTVPAGVNYVRIVGTMGWASYSNGPRYLMIQKNGAPLYTTTNSNAAIATVDSTSDPLGRGQVVTPPVPVAAGDVIALYVWNNSNTAVNLTDATLSIEAANGTTTSSQGSGTTGYLAAWTSSTNLGNSPIAMSGSNVGIGTTVPVSPLHVTKLGADDGLPATSGTSQTGLVARFSSTLYGAVMDFGQQGQTTGKSWIQVTDRGNLGQTYPLLLNPNGGFVGINTTNPTVPLQIGNSASYYVGTYGYLNTGGAAGNYAYNNYVSASVVASGRMVASEFNATSDRRAKEKIEPVSDDRAQLFLEKSQPVHFRWKEGERRYNYGFIAQDLDKLGFHELISAAPDQNLDPLIDDDGYISPKGIRLNLNYSEITALLTKIAQIQERKLNAVHRNGEELARKITSTDDTVAALQVEVRRLRASEQSKDRELEMMKARLERLEKALQK